MISANSFLIRMVENLKRRISMIVITGLVFFLAYPVNLLMSLSKYTGEPAGYYSAEEIAKGQLETVNNILGYNYLSIFLFAALAGIIALGGFSYLHKKTKVDFYHSMPVSATKRFFTIFINSALIFFVCGFVNLLLCYVICGAFDVFSMELLVVSIKAFLVGTLYAVGIMAITALATILTGKLLISFFGAVILGVYEIGLYLLVYLRIDRFFYSLVLDGDANGLRPKASIIWYYIEYLQKKVSALSESLFGMTDYQAQRLRDASAGVADATNGSVTVSLVMMAVMTVISIALAWFCFVKRPGESAGKTMAIEKTKRPIKLLVLIPATMLFCDIVVGITGAESYLLETGNLPLMLAMILFPVIGCMTFEVIYDMDIKAARKRLIDILIVFAVVFGIQCVLQYDVFGIDTYQPDVEQVESIGVADDSRYMDYEYYDEESLKQVYLPDNGIYVENFNLERCHEVMISDPEYKEAVLNIVAAANERNRQLRKGDSENFYLTDHLEVVFRLNSGKEVVRQYNVLAEEAAVLNNFALKSEKHAPVMLQAFCGTYKEQVFNHGYACVEDRSQYQTVAAETPEDMGKLREAYLKDMEDFTIEEGKSATMVGNLIISCPSKVPEDGMETAFSSSAGERDGAVAYYGTDDGLTLVWNYPIYDTFTNTLSYLSSHGGNPADYLAGKTIQRVVFFSGTDEDGNSEDIEIPIENTEVIEELVRIADTNYLWDPWKRDVSRDYDFGELRVEWTSPEHQNSVDSFSFRVDHIDAVKELLAGVK